jgi:CubicO group peptidase (beta-lactamase class C family)
VINHLLIFLFLSTKLFSQSRTFADSIRIQYKIPELAYAVISSDSIFEMEVLGVQQINSNYKATLTDKFRIGSNTKTITSYIATVLVKQGKIKWDTKFFDLYPEFKAHSNSAYYDVTLKDLLTLRANLIPWTYTNETPTSQEMLCDDPQLCFVAWVLRQKPATVKKTINWSNPAYVAAGLMLGKATGTMYETLVYQLGKELGIEFGFGQPNYKERNQPWGHDSNLEPEKPAYNNKLNWLSSAGNINVNLPDYSKFIQLQLQGLLGKSKILTAGEFETMHYGLSEFAFGWKCYIDDKTKLRYSYHEGNPGTFLSKVFICKEINKAFILFTNVQSDEADEGLNVLLAELKKRYRS